MEAVRPSETSVILYTILTITFQGTALFAVSGVTTSDPLRSETCVYGRELVGATLSPSAHRSTPPQSVIHVLKRELFGYQCNKMYQVA
jgi:hypothetical protein